MSKYSILKSVFICYLVPGVFLSGYSYRFMPLKHAWTIFSLSLGLIILGTFLLFSRLLKWEFQQEVLAEKPQAEPPPKTYEWELEKNGMQKKQQELQDFLDQKNSLIHTLQQENDEMQQRLKTFLQTDESTQLMESQLDIKNQIVQEQEQTINELRTIIEKHQEQIRGLEEKENELHYEIKTLLELTPLEEPSVEPIESFIPQVESPPPSIQEFLVTNSEQASLQLKRCLDIAAKMTGTHRFAQSQFSPEWHVDSSALDLRHLLDILRGENQSIVLMYSKKDNKLIFANSQVDVLLGWHPDKFVQQFSEIIQDSQNEWKQAIYDLTTHSEIKTELSVKSCSGKKMPLECHLGLVNSGIFRHSLIAIMYKA